MAETDTVVARLAAVIDEHAREADWEASVGGRPDLWPEVDVPLALVRDSHTELARLQAENEALRRERDEAREVYTVMSEEFRAAALCEAVQAAVGDHLPTLTARIEQAEAAREAAEAKAARLEEALGDLMSWFPKRASPSEWRLEAGPNGADDAVEAARAALEAK